MAARAASRTHRRRVSQDQSGRTGRVTRSGSSATRCARPGSLHQIQARRMRGEERFEGAGHSNVINPRRTGLRVDATPGVCGKQTLPRWSGLARAGDCCEGATLSFWPARGRRIRRARFGRSASGPGSRRCSCARRGSRARNHASALGIAPPRRTPCTRALGWPCRP